LAAEAAAAADYAVALGANPVGQRLHELTETHLKRAVTLWFQIGQLAAMPRLIARYRPKSGPARVDPQTSARPGRPLRLAVDPAKLHYFDPATGLRLEPERELARV